MEKILWTISEVSEILGEPVSKVRFWSDRFPSMVRPVRNAKGNRLYRKEDLDSLKEIKRLSLEGLTLDGIARQKTVGPASAASRTVRALEALKEIRASLEQIKESL